MIDIKNLFCLPIVMFSLCVNAQEIEKTNSLKNHREIHFYGGISPQYINIKQDLVLYASGGLLGLNLGFSNDKIGSYSSWMFGGSLLIPIYNKNGSFKLGYNLNGNYKIFFQEYEPRYPNFYGGVGLDLLINPVVGDSTGYSSVDRRTVISLVLDAQIGCEFPISYSTKIDCGLKVGYGINNTIIYGLFAFLKF